MSLLSRRFLRLRAALVCAALALQFLGGCASTGNPRDPFEGLNRGIYKFNDTVDNIVVKPVSEAYRDLVPAVFRTGISNFFSNIQDVLVALNNLLQGKLPDAINTVGRILVNTTLGVFGVMDVATELGVEKQNEDFGQTLGRWGFGPGPYVVIPFLGPSSLRDAVGLIGDWRSDPLTYVDPTRTRNQLYGLYYVSRRAELLEASRILETAALDPYEFVRDGYLQRRRSLVHDGNPPDEDDVETPSKPRPDGAGARLPLPASTDPVQAPVLVKSHPPSPTAIPVTTRLAAAASPGPQAEPAPKPNRVVKLWLPVSRN